MSKSKVLTPALFAVAFVFILGGIVLLAFVVPGAALFYQICTAIIAILAVLIGVGVLYYLYLARDNDPNFFLYDTKTERNIDASDLTFERVNSRMSYFMSTLTTSQERLWKENVLSVNPKRFGVKEIYKPLAAYKMLYDLAQIDRPEGWQLFLNADPAALDAILEALSSNDEKDMPLKLRQAFNSATDQDDYEWIRDYVMGNSKYIQSRMMGYVKKNIEFFY